MTEPITRRVMLRLTGLAAAGQCVGLKKCLGTVETREVRGLIRGEPVAEHVGQQVFADGGNAFDAIVAGALAAAIAAPHQTGIGGYGGAAMIASAANGKVSAIDFNTAAPAAMTADLFQRLKPLKDQHRHGWLAAGVPGILAGLQLILDRYGSRSFRELVQPAIRLARSGIAMTPPLASVMKAAATQFAHDSGSRKLYLPDGQPRAAGSTFHNPELAELLDTLAARGSVEAFYRGDVAQQIAEAFQQNGGLLTAADLANYRALEVTPLSLACGESVIHTAPLTAGGLTVLQAMRCLASLPWERLQRIERTHARVEALRLAWRDRLAFLADPLCAEVPVERLLSAAYAEECAAQVLKAIQDRTVLNHTTRPREQGGTIHLSAADVDGNFAALTVTHGDSFGARVTVNGLGLTLGHGMSRFEVDASHPNAPGAWKRPLHNMCPTIVTRSGTPVVAVGGRGGRRIPNAVFEAVLQFVVQGQSIEQSVAAPRLHTEGSGTIEPEARWPSDEIEGLRELGYNVQSRSHATLSAVAREMDELRAAMR